MESVKTVIYSVVYISVAAALSELLCPENYKKYLKVVIALVCCMAVITPLFGAKVQDADLNFLSYSDNTDYKKIYEDALFKQYAQDVEDIVRSRSADYKILINDDPQSEDYLQILSITIYDAPDFDFASKELGRRLGISEERILRGER